MKEQHIPKKINKGLTLEYNSNLKSLEGMPREINGDLSCAGNSILTLKGCPQKINGNLYLSGNKITSLDDFPTDVNGNVKCFDNTIEFTEEEIRNVCNVKGKVATWQYG